VELLAGDGTRRLLANGSHVAVAAPHVTLAAAHTATVEAALGLTATSGASALTLRPRPSASTASHSSTTSPPPPPPPTSLSPPPLGRELDALLRLGPVGSSGLVASGHLLVGAGRALQSAPDSAAGSPSDRASSSVPLAMGAGHVHIFGGSALSASPAHTVGVGPLEPSAVDIGVLFWLC
jgi:hypothetical protein